MDANGYASVGTVFFLFGIFRASWAQSTGRNAWLWFFAPITGVFLLYLNRMSVQPKNVMK